MRWGHWRVALLGVGLGRVCVHLDRLAHWNASRVALLRLLSLVVEILIVLLHEINYSTPQITEYFIRDSRIFKLYLSNPRLEFILSLYSSLVFTP